VFSWKNKLYGDNKSNYLILLERKNKLSTLQVHDLVANKSVPKRGICYISDSPFGTPICFKYYDEYIVLKPTNNRVSDSDINCSLFDHCLVHFLRLKT
jgi:hypothetical protein